MTLFDIIDDVIRDKTGRLPEMDGFDEAMDPFMLARFLSMRRSLMPYAMWINSRGSRMTKENIYRFLVDEIPRSGDCYIKYIRKPKGRRPDSG